MPWWWWLVGGEACLAGALAFVVARSRGATGWRLFARRGAAVLGALVATLLALEIAIVGLVAQSDSNDLTGASKRWFARYWRPINALGCRDIEHRPEDFAGRRVVMVVGDSFAAGHGIKNPGDRFSNRVGSHLAPHFAVLNVAVCGWNTPQELEAIAGHPVRPDVVVLSYLVNDIRDAAARRGREFDMRAIVPPRSPVVQVLLASSAVFDWCYWRIQGWWVTDHQRRYLQFLVNCYEDDDVWTEHRRELAAVVEATRARGAELVVVVFPLLDAIEETRPAVERVSTFFRMQGAAVLDVAALLDREAPHALVVSARDAHPSVWLHSRVANSLEPYLTGPFLSWPPESRGGASTAEAPAEEASGAANRRATTNSSGSRP